MRCFSWIIGRSFTWSRKLKVRSQVYAEVMLYYFYSTALVNLPLHISVLWADVV